MLYKDYLATFILKKTTNEQKIEKIDMHNANAQNRNIHLLYPDSKTLQKKRQLIVISARHA